MAVREIDAVYMPVSYMRGRDFLNVHVNGNAGTEKANSPGMHSALRREAAGQRR